MELGDRNSARYNESIEEVACPVCGQGKVTVSFIAGWCETRVSRIAAGAKRTNFFHDPRVTVHCKCPACGATKQEIRAILQSGAKPATHESVLKRARDAGLPVTIEANAPVEDEYADDSEDNL